MNRNSTIYLEHDGIRTTIDEWAARTGLPRTTIRGRYYSKKNLTVAEILAPMRER